MEASTERKARMEGREGRNTVTSADFTWLQWVSEAMDTNHYERTLCRHSADNWMLSVFGDPLLNVRAEEVTSN